jgi:hypothetical protein
LSTCVISLIAIFLSHPVTHRYSSHTLTISHVFSKWSSNSSLYWVSYRLFRYGEKEILLNLLFVFLQFNELSSCLINILFDTFECVSEKISVLRQFFYMKIKYDIFRFLFFWKKANGWWKCVGLIAHYYRFAITLHYYKMIKELKIDIYVNFDIKELTKTEIYSERCSNLRNKINI